MDVYDEMKPDREQPTEQEDDQNTKLFVGLMIAAVALSVILYVGSGYISFGDTEGFLEDIETGPDVEDEQEPGPNDDNDTGEDSEDRAWSIDEDLEDRIVFDCVEHAEYIANHHCLQFTRNGDCTDTSFESDPDNGYETTAADEACSWGDPDIVEEANPQLAEHVLTKTDGRYELTVTVEGEEYNCIEEGVITDRSCPVRFP